MLPMHPQIQQLYSLLTAYGNRVAQLEQCMTNMQQELRKLREQRAIHVDRIEYKFDQLKVERLEGTLTIGITPTGTDAIENLTVNAKEIPVPSSSTPDSPPSPAPDQHRQSRFRIDRFLEEECPAFLSQLEAEHQILLGTEYRSLMIEDIRKQIDSRISHYLQTLHPGEGQDAADRVIADIRSAIEQHFQTHLKGQSPRGKSDN